MRQSSTGRAQACREARSSSPGTEEITVVSIGNGSAAEGIFFETLNAAAVLQVPLVVCVWDDEFAISVPNAYQLAHGSVSEAVAGMAARERSPGLGIHSVRGWDYPALRNTIKAAVAGARSSHAPALVQVTELTQPLGHSTSGSQERYKTGERLAWENEHDCLKAMRRWLQVGLSVEETVLDEIEEAARFEAEAARTAAREARVDALAAEAAAIPIPAGCHGDSPPRA